jgi:hypothetical protein
MKKNTDTIERFAPYIKPITLLEDAFRLAGLDVEYATAFVGWEKNKALETFYYPVRRGDLPQIIGFEGMGPAETLSMTAALTLWPYGIPWHVFRKRLTNKDMERSESRWNWRLEITGKYPPPFFSRSDETSDHLCNMFGEDGEASESFGEPLVDAARETEAGL